jgi:hypothetical protein
MSDRRDSDSCRRSQDRRSTDRRLADRVTLDAGIRFLRAGSSKEQILSGELLDVSASGIRIALQAPVAVGEKVLVEVRDDAEQCFNMIADVVWAEPLNDGRHRVGCELCADLNARQLRTLKKLAAAHAVC